MSVRNAAYRPLAGIRILDFSWSLPGPYATHMLADLGAEIEVVEVSGRPEIFRTMPPLADGISYSWDYVNAGKRRRFLDRHDARAIAALHQEINGFDILVEQFRPGAMEAWGLGYPDLAALHPGLIYCSITGYGQEGTHSKRAGHDINYMALSGVAHGLRSHEGVPASSALPFADLAGGALHAVTGILAALQGRRTSGSGVHVDVSMTDALWALNAYAGPAALNGAGEEPGSGMLDGGSFYGHYRTLDGRWLAIGGLEPKFVDRLFQALGREDLLAMALESDPDMQAQVRTVLVDIIATRKLADWRAFFAPLDACVEPVLTVEEAASHPHFLSRGGTQRTGSGRVHFTAPLRFRQS